MERGRLGEAIEEHFVHVRIIQRILEVTLTRLGQSAGAGQRREKFDPRLDTQSAKNVIPVLITLIYRGSSGAGSLGHAAHGQRLFATPRPQPAGCVQYPLFELRICLSGQGPASMHFRVSLLGPTALTLTLYK